MFSFDNLNTFRNVGNQFRTKNKSEKHKNIFSKCLLRLGVLRVFVLFCVGFCTGHFVMVHLKHICIVCNILSLNISSIYIESTL